LAGIAFDGFEEPAAARPALRGSAGSVPRERGSGTSDPVAGEEIASSLSHGLGFVAAVASAPDCPDDRAARQAGERHRRRHLRRDDGALYFASMITTRCRTSAKTKGKLTTARSPADRRTHALQLGRSTDRLALQISSEPAAVGVTLKAFDRIRHPMASLGLYLLMGWLCVVAIGPLLERVPYQGLVLLAAGGGAYMAGVVFFATDSRLRYGHFIWHLFVLAGTSCHFSRCCYAARCLGEPAAARRAERIEARRAHRRVWRAQRPPRQTIALTLRDERGLAGDSSRRFRRCALPHIREGEQAPPTSATR
jgi:hemolysin III